MAQSAFRGLPEPQMTFLTDDIALLEHSDPGARRARLSTNGYAFLIHGRALLIDVNIAALTPFVRQIATNGSKPVALFLTHRHVAGTGDNIREIANEFKMPVLMHAIDASHPQSSMAQVQFEDAAGHPILAECGLETVLFPGHTEGHAVLYGAANGGVMFAGDAAMGTTAGEAASGLERLVRPPAQLSVADGELRRQWSTFDRPLATVLPYHGTGYLRRSPSEMEKIMAPLSSAQSMAGFA